MLLENIINVKVSNRTKKFFIEMGYIENDGFFQVDYKDMNDTNRTKVLCKCDYCGLINNITWSNYIVQINKTSQKKYSCHKCHYNKSKIVFNERYGTEYPSKLESVKNKIKKTNLEKYGVECVFGSEFVKDKIKKTNLEKYGTEYSISSEFVKNKITNSLIKRYEVENVFCSNSKFRESINEKLKLSLNNDNVKYKRSETCYEKYGVNNPMQSNYIKNKSKNTCMERYGVESPMQSAIIFNKQQKSSLKTKKHEKSNLSYQGTYELDFLEKYYDKIRIEKIDPIEYSLNENVHYYHPDFYLPDYNLIIEIKSSYTYNYDIEKNMAKKDYSLKAGYEFIFIIDKDYSFFELFTGLK